MATGAVAEEPGFPEVDHGESARFGQTHYFGEPQVKTYPLWPNARMMKRGAESASVTCNS